MSVLGHPGVRVHTVVEEGHNGEIVKELIVAKVQKLNHVTKYVKMVDFSIKHACAQQDLGGRAVSWVGLVFTRIWLKFTFFHKYCHMHGFNN